VRAPPSPPSSTLTRRRAALAFAYVDALLHAPDGELAVGAALSTLEGRLPLLEAAGFQRLVFEDFYDALADLVRTIVAPNAAGRLLSPSLLLAAFQSAEGAPAPTPVSSGRG
jgi:ubiquitin thioesterase protein OTUB1